LSTTVERVGDVIIVGAGIVGAACAHEFGQRGLDVHVIDANLGGATAAGMGHLVHVDGSQEELALCAYSLNCWQQLAPALPADCAHRNCGTLWLAEHADDRPAAQAKQDTLAQHGVASQWLDPDELVRREPLLRHGLAGALHVPGDGIVYAPAVARWLLDSAGSRVTCSRARVTTLDAGCVQLDDGSWRSANHVVLANGLGANALLGQPLLQPKKGQLVITDRYPSMIHHQLVELAYTRQAHARDGASVAFNVQPRPTGQILVGSSRQPDEEDMAIDDDLLARMLRRAMDFLPSLGRMTAIRAWTGLRAAGTDELPLLGAWPGHPGLWVNLGHEGHGITTAPGCARILADLICGHRPELDPTPYDPRRAAAWRQA